MPASSLFPATSRPADAVRGAGLRGSSAVTGIPPSSNPLREPCRSRQRQADAQHAQEREIFMKKNRLRNGVVLALVLAAGAVGQGSSHREARASARRPSSTEQTFTCSAATKPGEKGM